MYQGAIVDSGTSGQFRGLGLGLYIVREIARAHGGDVQVRSGVGGTVFSVHLPREASASALGG
jgi:signal transduction histidine kinase